MNLDDLREHLNRTISLKQELKDLKKNDLYKLSDYLEMFHQSLITTDFGERDKFWLPYYYSSLDLNELFDVKTEKFNSQFSANKTKLLSSVNRHIKGLQRGFREHVEELNSTRPD